MSTSKHDIRDYSSLDGWAGRAKPENHSPFVQCRVHSLFQLLSRAVAANRHILMLDVPPHRLDQVQLRAVWRQVEQLDACRLQSPGLLLDLLAMMRRVVVQYHHTPLLPDKPLRHLSNRRAHVANLPPDEFQHRLPLEGGAACGILQPRVITVWSKGANGVHSPTFRRFVRHDSSHSFSGPGVSHRQRGSKARLVQVVQLDEIGTRCLLQRFKDPRAACACAWSCGSLCLCRRERNVRFHRNLRLFRRSLRYLGCMRIPNCSLNHSANVRQVQVRPCVAEWSSSCSSASMCSLVSTGGRPGMGASARASKSPSCDCEAKRLRYLRTVCSCTSSTSAICWTLCPMSDSRIISRRSLILGESERARALWFSSVRC